MPTPLANRHVSYCVLTAALMLAAGSVSAAAGSFDVLHTFTGADGANPVAGLVQDSAGNLYGETFRGGSQTVAAQGTVYKISPDGAFTTLVVFTGSNGANGAASPTLIGQTLYGTAENGGQDDYGVIFSVHTDGTAFTLLHSFSYTDGAFPGSQLRAGPHGVGYGVADQGGPYHYGVLFELKSDGTFIILHSFTGGADGAYPTAILVGPSGTIYGGTTSGGPYPEPGELGYGVIYSYVPATGVFTTLHDFLHTDGTQPNLGSVGADGTLYGTTKDGGAGDSGTLFSLGTASANQPLITLYSFNTNNGFPAAGPTLNPDGSLVGGTNSILYQYASGKLTTLYRFGNRTPSGDGLSQPILAGSGSFIGATDAGGMAPCTVNKGSYPAGCGTVYSYTP